MGASSPVVVCPRCGTAAGDHAWCTTCGLNLKAQAEPTAEADTSVAAASPLTAELACPRCGTTVGDRRWCTACGLDLESLEHPGEYESVSTLVSEDTDRPAVHDQETATALLPPQPPPVIAPPPPASRPPPRERSSRSDRNLLIGVGGVVLVLVAAGAALFAAGVFGSTHRAPHARASASRSTRPKTPVAPAATTTTAAALTTTPTATTQSTTGSTTPSNPAPDPAKTITTHLSDLNSGHYEAAFHLLTASYQAQNPSWPSDRAAADPGVDVTSIGKPQYGVGGAEVPVTFYARDRHASPGSDTLCREFLGKVKLVHETGGWRYDPGASSLVATVVPSSNPHCPS